MNHHPVQPANRGNARKMRKAMTEAELKLWNEVRAHRLMGLAFRRQTPMAYFIVDFAYPSRKLVIEVDGSQHGDSAHLGRDVVRDKALSGLGDRAALLERRRASRHRQCLHIVTAAGLAATDDLLKEESG